MTTTSLSPARTCIRQGARTPALELVPGLGCGETWDPAAFASYTLNLAGPVNITGALVYDEDEGALVFAWPAASTNIPGTYAVTVTATTSGGLVQVFPCQGWAELVIEPLPG